MPSQFSFYRVVIVRKSVDGVTAPMLARFLGKARRSVGVSGEVTLLLSTNAELKRLNRQFRGKAYATDVLSFPSEFDGHGGDIAISADIACRNGQLLGHGTAVEVKVLILHGLLHLAGYDHESDNGRMARAERRLRRLLGLPEGLIERADREPVRKGTALTRAKRPQPSADKSSKSRPAMRARRSRKR